jgi:polyisoprenoid-binding protein YceI
MRRAAAAGAALAAAASFAQAPEVYVVDPAHTFPAFEVSHLGIATQRGRFDRTRGRVTLDRAAHTGTIEIETDSASVSTGNAKLDAVLRSDEFFDVERHPKIAFRAEKLELRDDVPVRAEGILTMHGVTHPVTLEVRQFACTRKPFLVRTTCGADVEARLSRSAFGMAGYASFVGDEVRIVIQVEAVRQEPAAEPQDSGG